MRLTDADALGRLAAHDHGVLCTMHPERGADAVPCVYAVDGDRWLGIPVDRVKPKSTTRLRREANLAADPRATLLIEHWDRNDWTTLWWVRAELRHQPNGARADALAGHLSARFEQYADRPFERVLVFEIVGVAGWSAAS
jgi:Pyridoxamine 5'-phosphate oxidase